jgi:hypothetical protein
MSSFWPKTAQEWVGLIASILGVLGVLIAFIKWGWPILRKAFGRTYMPDVRVKVMFRVLITQDGSEPPIDCIVVTVENHSPNDVHLTSIGIKVKGGGGLWPVTDSVWATPNQGGTVRPGDNFQFNISPKNLDKEGKDRKMLYAYASDKIGREFRSSRRELMKAIAESVMAMEGKKD